MRDFSDDLKALRTKLEEAKRYLSLERQRDRMGELESLVADPELWNDQDRARDITTELSRVKDDVELLDGLDIQIEDVETLYELSREEADESVEPEVEAQITTLDKQFRELELRSLFTGEHDENDAVLEVFAKDGGTDAQDWTEMVERMYMRWAEGRGFAVEVVDRSEGTEAGINSTSMIVKGRYAYGLLTGEKGVHRLVRNSPFDSQHRRQTSFALVKVTPFLDSTDVEIEDKDLRIDTFRASGAGGQHVNKTDSAIRITHMPTGTVVSCQNERSQTQNKARAMQVLAAKLAELAEEEHRAQLAELSGPTVQVGWGSQIRNYVISQYNLVKDDRSKHESSNPQGVFDGDLDEFMEAYLRWRRAELEAPSGG